MKFNLSTKPLKDAMDLGIISSNISKFFEKSTVIELTVEDDTLRLNTQATSILSESYIQGHNEGGQGVASAIVDATLFKSLIGTIDASEIGLTFGDNALVVTYGKSKFNVPLLLTDEDEVSLDRPKTDDLDSHFCGELHPDTWKYIQEHQLYAVAMSQIDKAYTRVWVSEDKGVLTGDPNLSLFTYQPSCDLVGSCLVSTTVVNLMSILDAGSKMYNIDDDNYVVVVDQDSFKFVSQFTVDHENSNGIGSYASDMIFDMVLEDSDNEVNIEANKLYGTIKQAALFVTPSDPLIYMESGSDGLKLTNNNVDCKISSDASMEYSIGFTVSDIDTVVSHMGGENLTMSPIIKENEVFGIRFKSGDMVALIGGVE